MHAHAYVCTNMMTMWMMYHYTTCKYSDFLVGVISVGLSVHFINDYFHPPVW